MKLQDIVAQNLVLSSSDINADRELIRHIQQELAKANLIPYQDIDGICGTQTHDAIAEFCRLHNLNNHQTRLYGKSFAQALIGSKYLTDADYALAAGALGVEVAVLKAVISVETSGKGFFDDGRPKILFEAHHFDRLTDGQYRQSFPDISSRRWNPSLYIGGTKEYIRLEKAQKLNENAALQSASWGLGQIMGFNHNIVGYSSISAFVRDMYKSEAHQLNAIVNFIKSQNLDDALKAKKWAVFARGYNGEQFAKHQYDTRLAAAYNQFKNI